MIKFSKELFISLPKFEGNGLFTGEFFNEENVLTGGYKGSNSEIHLVIECNDDIIKDIKLHGVEIKNLRIIHPDFGDKNYIDYCPSHSDFADNVLIICNEILVAIENGESSQEATRRILQKWEYFLLKPRSLTLNEEKIIGLYGELFVLNWLLEQGKDEITLLENWLGPTNNPRDFEFTNYWIEVKTTKKKNNEIEIHGLKQLECPSDINSYLWLNIISRDLKSISLVEIINYIDKKLQSAVANLIFREKLVLAGYHLADAGFYNEERFKIERVSVFHIDADFPKITSEMIEVPERVSGLAYTINLYGIIEVIKEKVFEYDL
jgi:hypothetical protein